VPWTSSRRVLVVAAKTALSMEHVRLLVSDRKRCRAKGCEWESEFGEDIVSRGRSVYAWSEEEVG
jgi:hypothetical protein